MRRISLAVVLVAIVAGGTIAQKAGLTDDDIRAAIEAGGAAKGKDHGVEIWFRAPSFGNMGVAIEPRVMMYTPILWVRQQAALAARKIQDAEPE